MGGGKKGVAMVWHVYSYFCILRVIESVHPVTVANAQRRRLMLFLLFFLLVLPLASGISTGSVLPDKEHPADRFCGRAPSRGVECSSQTSTRVPAYNPRSSRNFIGVAA